MRTIVAILCFSFFCSQFAHSEGAHDATEQLKQAEERWKMSSPSAYYFTVRYSAFVLTYGCESQSFLVSGTRSKPVSSIGCKSQPRKLGSIPALFHLAHKLLAEKPDEVSAEYDSTYGYPIKFYVGSADLEDSYFQFEIVEFKEADGKSNP